VSSNVEEFSESLKESHEERWLASSKVKGFLGSEESGDGLTGETQITPFHDLRFIGFFLNDFVLLLEGFSVKISGITVFHPVNRVKIT
jgi:hypothetical protein